MDRIVLDPEIESLVPSQEITRRDFVAGILASGFALAVQPVSAQTIVTDTSGLDVADVKIPVHDGTIPAYRAMPKGGTSLPTIIVVQEIFGVHEHIKDICRRLAKVGYFAVAPALFARQGDPSKLQSPSEIQSKISSKVPDKQVMSDLDATVAWAKKTGSANTEKLGITGFCWGGRVVWLYSAHNPQLKAGVAWYGRLASDITALQPTHPINIAKTLKAPVLGLYGGADTGIPNETVDAMQRLLASSNSPSKIVVYPDAPHAFNADYRPSYRKEAAEDAWKQMLAWFKAHGVS